MRRLLHCFLIAAAWLALPAVAPVQAADWALQPPCESQARPFLVAPPFEEARSLNHPGSRQWDFNRILKAERSGAIPPNCRELIWKQADLDAAEYWTFIGEKYGCLTEEMNLPGVRPANCPEKKWTSVKANLDFLVYVRSLHEGQTRLGAEAAAAPDCSDTESPDPVDTLAVDLVDIIEPEPTPPTPTPQGDLGIDINLLLATGGTPQGLNSGITEQQLMARDPCAEIPAEKRGTSAEGWLGIRDQTWGCVKGAAEGIYDTLESTIMGLWDLLVLGKDIIAGAGSAVIELAQAMCGGSVTALITEWAMDAEAATSKLAKAIMGIPEAIYGWLESQSDYFMCLNTAAQTEYICKATTRVVGEIGVAAIGAGAAAKAGKVPAVMKATTWVEDSVKATRLGAAALSALTAYRNLRILESVPTGLRWLRDSSLGREIALQGEKVLVRIDGKVAEVVNSSLASKLKAGLSAAESAAAASYRYLKAVPTSAKAALDRGLDWVRDTRTGLSVAYREGKAYIKRSGAILEVTRTDLVEQIRVGATQALADFERKMAQYQDELAEWRARQTRPPVPASVDDAIRGHDYYPDRLFKDWSTPAIPEGFKLHVSATAENMAEVADAILPVLRERGIAHKVVATTKAYVEKMTGTQRGKFITIYPSSAEEAAEIARICDEIMTKRKLTGYQVPDERILGQSGAVSVRYGGFTKGTITGPDGFEIPDVRGGSWKPNWVTDPFPP